ncbi:hypothetical protein [Nocardia sp. NPDC004260]
MTAYRIGPVPMTVLTILAFMYGAPLDVVARMLGVRMPIAYRHVAKWRASNLVSSLKLRPVPGPTWVFPTRSAIEGLTGLSTQFWTPTPKMAAHVRTVLELRLALVGLDLERWTSERELRAQVGPVRAGEARPHIHDGRYYDEQGRLWAVEVELTAKNAAAARIAVAKAKQAAAKASCDKLIYYCRNGEIRNVIADAARAAAGVEGPSIRVATLAEAFGTTSTVPGSRPGLSLISGGASDRINQATSGGRDTGEAVS